MNDTPETPAVAPLLAPDPSLVRASAIWVTIANWADALASRFGDAEILAGERVLRPAEARSALTGRETSTARPSPRWRRSKPAVVGEMLLKDLRWLRRGRSLRVPDGARYEGCPFVWQHHDLFHRRGRAMADALGVPLVHFVDAPQVWESGQWGIRRPVWGRAVERFGELPQLREADVVAVVSAAIAHIVIELGVEPHRIVVTPCTADPERFLGRDRELTRTRLDLQDSIVVGWIGSFRPFHALDLLIDAFADVARQVRSARLLLVGDGPEAPAIRLRAAELGVGDRVMMPGAVPHHAVPEHLVAMDVGVLPAREGSFHYSPLKIRELLAASVPVVAADVDDAVDLLGRSGAGWLYRRGVPGDLARTLASALSDPAELAARGRRGLEFAATELTMQRQVEQITAAAHGARTRHP